MCSGHSEKTPMSSASPSLLAIVEVDPTQRVYCVQPGCKHTVFKAIHVVRDGDQLLVLGSTCFRKRYGSATALGKAKHGGGNSKLLTSEERVLLANNTEALLARFAAEEDRLREEAAIKLKRLKEEWTARQHLPSALIPGWSEPRSMAPRPAMAPRKSMPWSWMKPNSSVAAFKLHDGSGWVRVQHRDGQHFIVPWPCFEGWEESLPPVVGHPDVEIGGYEVVGEVVSAISYLRSHAAEEKITGLWHEVVALLGARVS